MMIPDADQAAVLEALLAEVPVHGWTEAALRRALAALGRPEDEAALVFPNGAGEMIEAFCARADQIMEDEAAGLDIAARRVPERVRVLIALRLQQNLDHKEAIRRAMAWLALPGQAALAARITARTVDAIWHAAGDQSADFSWYTKRGILAGVYGATLLYWLREPGDDDLPTLEFLDRRLAGVGRFGAMMKRLRAYAPGTRGAAA